MSSETPRDHQTGGGRTDDEMELGVFGRPHGVRGAIHLRLHNPESDAFETLRSVLVETGPRTRTSLIIESLEQRPKSVVLNLEGIRTREAAEKLTGQRAFALRRDLPALRDDEYYLMDLIGCRVFVGEESIGVVGAVRGDPTVDTMIIERNDGTTVEQPILGVWVKDVDIAAKRVELVGVEGFIV